MTHGGFVAIPTFGNFIALLRGGGTAGSYLKFYNIVLNVWVLRCGLSM